VAELFGPSSSEKNPFEELTVVYVLYFDEARGHMPLLIYPDDRYKEMIRRLCAQLGITLFGF